MIGFSSISNFSIIFTPFSVFAHSEQISTSYFGDDHIINPFLSNIALQMSHLIDGFIMTGESSDDDDGTLINLCDGSISHLSDFKQFVHLDLIYLAQSLFSHLISRFVPEYV